MNSVFGHCRDSFWTIQFGGFCEFGSRSGGAQGSKLELTVDDWSSGFRIGADGSNLEHTVHVLEFPFWIWSSWLNG